MPPPDTTADTDMPDLVGLQLQRANAPGADGRFTSEHITPQQLAGDTGPMVVSLSGILNNHDEEQTSVLSTDQKLAGIRGQSAQVSSVVATYPDAYLNPAMYNEIMQNKLGPAGNPYSPYAQQLTDAIIGHVPEYGSLSPDAQKAEVLRIQKAVGSKVFVGMSMGTVVSDGLQNAMVHELEQKGFPENVIHEQVMPQLKIVNYAAIGPQQRNEGHKPTGATVISILNNRDEVLHPEHNELKRYGLQASPHQDGLAIGTAITRVGEHEAFMTVTLPEHGSYELPANMDDQYHVARARQNDDGQMIVDETVRNPNGHNPKAFTSPIGPDHAMPAKPSHGLSYTQETGKAPANAIRNLLEHAKAVAATPDGQPLPPPPDIIESVVKPHASTPGEAYEPHMRSVIAYDGKIRPQDRAISGEGSAYTPLVENQPEIVSKPNYVDIGSGRLLVSTEGMAPADKAAFLATMQERGIQMIREGKVMSVKRSEIEDIAEGHHEALKISTEIPAGLDIPKLRGWSAPVSNSMSMVSNSAIDGFATLQLPEGTSYTPGGQMPEGAKIIVRSFSKNNADYLVRNINAEHPDVLSAKAIHGPEGHFVEMDARQAITAGLLGETPDTLIVRMPTQQGNGPLSEPTSGVATAPQQTIDPSKLYESYEFASRKEAENFRDMVIIEANQFKKPDATRAAKGDFIIEEGADGKATVKLEDGVHGVIPYELAELDLGIKRVMIEPTAPAAKTTAATPPAQGEGNSATEASPPVNEVERPAGFTPRWETPAEAPTVKMAPITVDITPDAPTTEAPKVVRPFATENSPATPAAPAAPAKGAPTLTFKETMRALKTASEEFAKGGEHNDLAHKALLKSGAVDSHMSYESFHRLMRQNRLVQSLHQIPAGDNAAFETTIDAMERSLTQEGAAHFKVRAFGTDAVVLQNDKGEIVRLQGDGHNPRPPIAQALQPKQVVQIDKIPTKNPECDVTLSAEVLEKAPSLRDLIKNGSITKAEASRMQEHLRVALAKEGYVLWDDKNVTRDGVSEKFDNVGVNSKGEPVLLDPSAVEHIDARANAEKMDKDSGKSYRGRLNSQDRENFARRAASTEPSPYKWEAGKEQLKNPIPLTQTEFPDLTMDEATAKRNVAQYEWHKGVTEDDHITRVPIDDMSPTEIGRLEQSLRKLGLEPQRAVSQTHGNTIRITGTDNVATLEGHVAEGKIAETAAAPKIAATPVAKPVAPVVKGASKGTVTAPTEPGKSTGVVMNATMLAGALVESVHFSEMSGGRKALVVTSGAMGATGIVSDLAGFSTVSNSLGMAGGLLGVGTSTYGLVQSARDGNVTGMVMSSGGLVSSGSFTVAAAAQFLGKAGLAADATGVGAIAGIVMQTAGIGLSVYSAHEQSKEYYAQVNYNDAVAKQDATAGVSQNFRDIGLPLKPRVDEYHSLNTLNNDLHGDIKVVVDDGRPKDAKELVGKLSEQENYDKFKSYRDDANHRLTNWLGSSSVMAWVIDSKAEERDLETVAISETGMQRTLTAQGALKEMNGDLPAGPNGKKPRGYMERMEQYEKVMKPLEEKYPEQIAKLNALPDIYHKLQRSDTIDRMERTMGMAGKNETDAKKRDYFEHVIAPGYTQNQNELATEQKKLGELEQYLEGNKKTTVYSGGSRRSVSVREFTPEEKTQLQAQIKEEKAKIGTLQHSLDAKHERAMNYVALHLAQENIAKERELVEHMTPEKQEEYFKKNAEFLKEAQIKPRADLAWTGLSTSRAEYEMKSVIYAPEQVVGKAEQETHTNKEALQQVGSVKEALQTKLAAANMKPDQIPDPELVDDKGKPVMRKVLSAEGTEREEPVTLAQMQTEMKQSIEQQTEALKQLREQVAKYGTEELKARLAISEAGLSKSELDLGKMEVQTLAYQVSVAEKGNAKVAEKDKAPEKEAEKKTASFHDHKDVKHALAGFKNSLVAGTGAAPATHNAPLAANVSFGTGAGSSTQVS